ncbi:MFS transporter [Anaerotardibacter muris]|uniref:MFS transporter n=1 Tax=Anaerotardibacter muris TaxID=2941505 RepID=UPI00203DECD5|nr:MFS transporter [Anaerotardibacter muris]
MAQSKKVLQGFLPVIAFGFVACILYGLGAGLRSDIGILLNPLAEHCSASYQDVSFCIAVMNLVFGAAQPVFGIIAARRSNRSVLLIGVGLLFASMVGMLLADSFFALLFSLGILFGIGAGALAFGLILASSIRRVGPERAMLISGVLNAAAGMGGFVLSPTIQALLDEGGISLTLSSLIAPIVLLIPIVFVVTAADPKKARKASGPCEVERKDNQVVHNGSARELFRRAFSDKVFILLIAGFSTCGFHMVTIESHLFSQFLSYGIGADEASWAFSLYGVATVFGALLSGWLSVKVPKGGLLAFYYGFRAVWVLIFIFLMPKTLLSAILFSAGLGLTGDATVSPTAGIVNGRFSLTEAATLIGVLFFCHQIGAFLSAWLGGILLEMSGSYIALWMIDVALCTLAGLASAHIRKAER